MAGTSPDAVELGSRVRAARVYSGVSQIELADAIGVSPGTLGRWENGLLDQSYKREALLDIAVKTTGLPEEFFTIDFNDLPLMQRSWSQARRLPRPEDLEQIVDDALEAARRPG